MEKLEKKALPVNGGYPLHTFQELEEAYASYIFDADDKKSIREAFEFVVQQHEGQTRRSGEPYYHHLIEV